MAWVDLEGIERFLLPIELLSLTQDELRRFGSRRKEGRVMWAGSRTDEVTMRIEEAVTPKQRNYFGEVIVDHAEIQRVNLDWCDRGLIPIGQVHTHPAEAWHSEEDDHFPISTQRGSLSLVIPDFAAGPRTDLRNCALFRLSQEWLEVDVGLIQVEKRLVA